MATRPQIIGFETTRLRHGTSRREGIRMPSSIRDARLLQAFGTTAVVAFAWAGFLGAMVLPQAQMVLLVLPAALMAFSSAERDDALPFVGEAAAPSRADAF